MHLNILVFPCGSEIALELHRSLKYSRHITLFGANSIDDHGKFIYENYIGNVPFYNSEDFLQKINEIIKKYNIDAIYPAMDSVIAKFSEISDQIDCKIIGSSNETNQICLSKSLTYKKLNAIVQCPKLFDIDHIRLEDFPLFIKPEIGYGSRGANIVKTIGEIHNHLLKYPNSIITEFLPGDEFTIDCFTDRHGELKFYGPRIRDRISNGISVNTKIFYDDNEQISNIVNKINKTIRFRGAWFVQLKYNNKNELTLLEIASRFGGSSALYRNQGINFGLLSIFDAFDLDVDIISNSFNIELDRALNNKYRIDIDYDTVYSDFDDCLIINNKVNITLLGFLYQCLNENLRIKLITKHEFDIFETLREYRLEHLFDEIIHLKKTDKKYKYIKESKSIFIDDSYIERKEILENLNIPVFAPDSVESLIK